MKLGCACWTFTKGRFLPPYEPAVEIIGELGFEGVEFILRNVDDLDEYWTASRVDTLRALCARYDLAVSQFSFFQDTVADLANLDGDARQRALDVFARGVRLAVALGAQLVNFVSQWPVGIKAPAAYVPRYWYTNQPGLDFFQPKLTMQLPQPFVWDQIWESYVDSIRQCVQIVEQHGLKLAFEGHAHVIVPHTDSFLRLWDHIRSPALGYNLDTAWQFIQREYLPWSVYKLSDKLLHVHARDGDGLHCYSLPPGEGIIDWPGLVQALRDVGYDGFISLELGGLSDPIPWVTSARRHLNDALIHSAVQETRGNSPT